MIDILAENKYASYLIFAAIGYLLGSILFAKVWGRLISKKDITKDTVDNNPGTFNAFQKGGFICGSLTVICDLAKGFLPVFFCLMFVDGRFHDEILMGVVMVMPVIGHILPLYSKFQGGKGIATSFGVLLGFLPDLRPALILAVTFIAFSAIIVIMPDFYKTIATYIAASIAVFFMGQRTAVILFYAITTVMVCVRLAYSKEERNNVSVSIFKWQVYNYRKEEIEE